MSMQELLNLTAPRAGNVDPATCLECAKLRKKVRAAGRKRDPEATAAAVRAMEVHKAYGHPDDLLPIAVVPAGSPRIV